jgi:uncharacterized membrane protein
MGHIGALVWQALPARGAADHKELQMVYQTAAAGGAPHTFVVQPNRSMSWRAQLLAFGLIAGMTMGVGTLCFVIGLPLVLPFSGIEVLALAAALYVTARRGGIKQVITITEDAVAVETGRAAPESRAEFQRNWVRVVLQGSGDNWYPSRLLIRSHGREVEVGGFLNEQERRGLAAQLQAAMGRAETIKQNVREHEPRTEECR